MVAATEAQYSLSNQDAKRSDAVCIAVIVMLLPVSLSGYATTIPKALCAAQRLLGQQKAK
jgi:hypothetical protein